MLELLDVLDDEVEVLDVLDEDVVLELLDDELLDGPSPPEPPVPPVPPELHAARERARAKEEARFMAAPDSTAREA